jgi:hypothetical protein
MQSVALQATLFQLPFRIANTMPKFPHVTGRNPIVE